MITTVYLTFATPEAGIEFVRKHLLWREYVETIPGTSDCEIGFATRFSIGSFYLQLEMKRWGLIQEYSDRFLEEKPSAAKLGIISYRTDEWNGILAKWWRRKSKQKYVKIDATVVQPDDTQKNA